MNTEEILHDLTFYEGLPRKALQAATAQRSEMVASFLEQIEEYLARGEADQMAEAIGATPLFFIFHLFGEWRETAAYRPLARLLRCPAEEVDEIFGDGLTETAHRVMAAVFDGDPQPLYDIILDPKAEEFVRARMCETVAMLVLQGRIPRPEAARFLRDGFTQILPQAECYVWKGWQSAIALLGLVELKQLVKKVFDRGFIHRQWLHFDHFEKGLARGVESPGEPRFPGDSEFTLFGEAIEEFSTWYGFSEKSRRAREQARQRPWDELDSYDVHEEPVSNPFRHVGRNDTCPCGSGKKFKRCCLQ